MKRKSNGSAILLQAQAHPITVERRLHERTDFLVVGDKANRETWQLPVKIKGKPNRQLAAAAELFLTSGHNGKLYEGERVQQATDSLKALYKSQGWTWGEAQALLTDEKFVELCDRMSESNFGLAEFWDDYLYSMPWVPFGATSFEQLDALQDAQERAERIGTRTYQLGKLVERIADNDAIENKLDAWRAVFDEFLGIMSDELKVQSANGETESAELAEMNLAESGAGTVLSLVEDDTSQIPQTSQRDPLRVRTRIIKPGWGNTADNNYYPREMLERDATHFVGAKMYTTDHRAEEKSVRTEVAVIERLDGFDEDGSPIGVVNMFDPDFAEATRNRHKAGLLHTLECSIFALGKGKKGTAPDGRKGTIIESISQVLSVDWVTRAGAGGKALALAESEGRGADNMPNKITAAANGQTVLQTTATETSPAPQAAKVDLVAKNVTITESQTVAAGDVKPEATPEPTPDVPATNEAKPEATPSPIAAKEIGDYLAAKNIPQAVRDRVAHGVYTAISEVDAAIAAEIQYLKEATGSGKPRIPQTSDQSAKLSEADREREVSAVLRRY